MIKFERALHVLPRPVVEAAEGLSQQLPRIIKSRLMVQMGVRFRPDTQHAAG